MWLRACLEDKLFNLSRCQLLERQEEFFIGRMVRRCICLEYVDQGGKFGWSWMNNGKQNSEEKIGVYIWKFGVVWTVRVCSAFEQAESFSFNLGRAGWAGSLYLFKHVPSSPACYLQSWNHMTRLVQKLWGAFSWWISCKSQYNMFLAIYSYMLFTEEIKVHTNC
jgi:hypothetical protein